MSIQVDGYEVLWDADNVYLRFTDKNGNGESLVFARDEMQIVSEAICIALIDMYEY